MENENSIEFESYNIPNNNELNEKLKYANHLKEELNKYRNIENKNHIWSAIYQKLRFEWTYHSNAIEGSTLTLGETIFFLNEGLTVEGKPFKDFLDAKNHSEAIELIFDFISNKREISEGFIKEINALLLSGVTHSMALDQFGNKVKKIVNAGQYKKLPNSVIEPTGNIHYYISPEQVPTEMNYLFNWIKNNIDKIDPIILGAISHYNMVRIHPFDDGNGRGARILMNLIFMKKSFPPAIVKNENRRKYLEALKEADKNNNIEFISFIAQSLIDTQESMISELSKN